MPEVDFVSIQHNGHELRKLMRQVAIIGRRQIWALVIVAMEENPEIHEFTMGLEDDFISIGYWDEKGYSVPKCTEVTDAISCFADYWGRQLNLSEKPMKITRGFETVSWNFTSDVICPDLGESGHQPDRLLLEMSFDYEGQLMEEVKFVFSFGYFKPNQYVVPTMTLKELKVRDERNIVIATDIIKRIKAEEKMKGLIHWYHPDQEQRTACGIVVATSNLKSESTTSNRDAVTCARCQRYC